MTLRTAQVRNEYGIHCRPAAIIAKEAQSYGGSIMISNGKSGPVAAKSVMGLISLGIACGQTVKIEVDGPDAESMADTMRELFETNFDFSR